MIFNRNNEIDAYVFCVIILGVLCQILVTATIFTQGKFVVNN